MAKINRLRCQTQNVADSGVRRNGLEATRFVRPRNLLNNILEEIVRCTNEITKKVNTNFSNVTYKFRGFVWY